MYLRLVSLFCLVGCMGFTTCTPRHQKGGGATTDVPQTGAEVPVLHMGMNQPENPEGSSSMSSKQITTTHHPDGRVVVNHIETATTIGGSQPMAEIVKAYVASDYFKGLLAGLGMTIAAWWMYRKEWEMTAAVLFISGVFCVFWSWLAAPMGIGAAVLLAGGHYKTIATKIIT